MRLTASLAGLALIASAAIASALSDADKCEAAKHKIAGKYGLCRAIAEARAIKTGAMPDFAKCDAKFNQKWGTAETKGEGMCPSTGDLTSMQARITGHVDAVAACLAGTCPPPPPPCGNGVIDSGEDCDQADLDGETCATQGFANGTLACGAGCSLDTTACWNVRFVDNADGTITDHATGLQWEKKTELGGGTNFANPHDADNGYRWAGSCTINTAKRCQPTAAAAAACAAHAEIGTTGCEECTVADGPCDASATIWTLTVDLNTATFAGHSDWRVPTRTELDSIVDYADTTQNPATNIAFHGPNCGPACTDLADPNCSCTAFAEFYWSASTVLFLPSEAWVIGSSIGGTSRFNKHWDPRLVRLVRGG